MIPGFRNLNRLNRAEINLSGNDKPPTADDMKFIGANFKNWTRFRTAGIIHKGCF